MMKPLLAGAMILLQQGGAAAPPADCRVNIQPGAKTSEIVAILKCLEDRIRVLERGGVAPSAAGKGASGATGKGAPVPAVGGRPGWVISVLPYSRDASLPDALFRFAVPKLPLRFDAHNAIRNIDNWVSYRGEAKFLASRPGRYVINFDLLAPPDGMYCSVNMSVDSQAIIDMKNQRDIEIRGSSKLTLSGGIDLGVGVHDVNFKIGCVNSHARGYLGGVSFGDLSLRLWRQMGFDILVRGPQDDVPRPFSTTELYNIGRQ